MCAQTLAVDFGTSNSAAAYLDNGEVRRIAVEPGEDTLPTAVFFPTEGGQMLVGSAAGKALIAGEDGRYMRALKSILGTALFHEERPIGGKRRKLADIVAAFLIDIRQKAEAETGSRFNHVLSGRPVRFHSTDDARDARAEADLRACYHAAGFERVDFLFEPEAAARASFGLSGAGETGLIVDIGGGTSDFTLFRNGTDGIEILASHGIRLGGTDFDTEVSMAHAMPLLGHGGELRRSFGDERLPVPNAIYRDLASWAKIPFLYARNTERQVADMLAHAVEPKKIGRLEQVITERLGHDLAFAVEAGKIAANGSTAPAQIDMSPIEAGLAARITQGSLNACLSGFSDRLREAIMTTLIAANTPPSGVQTAIFVGGSSLMSLVRSGVEATCPFAGIRHSDAFTAIVDGLTLATSEEAFA
ncbi:Hsp70 family protein [Aliiruegeria sabulilitoris]|uniref:Hsp70 family protein n=1 Tax=Aliiruegeria sabulilitoris TaxID=1510458 RepID=UPI000834A397|nr:Hsp70 family protein [Aliiruegeria sabulilitoris]NDR55000.1 Hsp70 family protein [Pseudoruegeria sp. M32A2M]